MKKQRLYRKYNVTKAEDGSPVEGDVFVLRLDRDPHARAAMQAYAHSVKHENLELALDISTWLVDIERREQEEKARLKSETPN